MTVPASLRKIRMLTNVSLKMLIVISARTVKNMQPSAKNVAASVAAFPPTGSGDL